MPTFNIQLFEGRTVDQKRAFVEAITRVTCETLGCEPAGRHHSHRREEGELGDGREAVERRALSSLLI